MGVNRRLDILADQELETLAPAYAQRQRTDSFSVHAGGQVNRSTCLRDRSCFVGVVPLIGGRGFL